jgi:hypothetical protein
MHAASRLCINNTSKRRTGYDYLRTQEIRDSVGCGGLAKVTIVVRKRSIQSKVARE